MPGFETDHGMKVYQDGKLVDGPNKVRGYSENYLLKSIRFWSPH